MRLYSTCLYFSLIIFLSVLPCLPCCFNHVLLLLASPSWGDAVSEGVSAAIELRSNLSPAGLGKAEVALPSPDEQASPGQKQKRSIMSTYSGKIRHKLQENDELLQACPLTFWKWRYSGHEHIAPPAVAKHVVPWGQRVPATCYPPAARSVADVGDLHVGAGATARPTSSISGSGISSDVLLDTSNPPARPGQKWHRPVPWLQNVLVENQDSG